MFVLQAISWDYFLDTLRMNIQITYAQAMKAVQMTQQLLDETSLFFNAQQLEPNADSLASTELQGFQRPESLLTAYSQGSLLIEVAADHLIGFIKALTEPAQSIAPWTIARAVLEASALSSWLLDAKIDAHTRIKRSFAFRYEGLIQQKKFIQVSGLKTEVANVNKRIGEVEELAESLGFVKLRNDKGMRTGVAQIMPSVTEIIRDTFDEESNYRLYSAMTHAHHWAYVQLGFRKAGKDVSHENKVFLMEKYLSFNAIWWLCSNVIRYFAKPIKYKCELFGWDLQQLNNTIENVYQEIGNLR